jgi:hypothetical protein
MKNWFVLLLFLISTGGFSQTTRKAIKDTSIIGTWESISSNTDSKANSTTLTLKEDSTFQLTLYNKRIMVGRYTVTKDFLIFHRPDMWCIDLTTILKPEEKLFSHFVFYYDPKEHAIKDCLNEDFHRIKSK